jgi:hypothetical protein
MRQQLQLQRRESLGQFLLHRWPLLARRLLELAHDQRLHALGLVQVVGHEASVEGPTMASGISSKAPA